MDNCEKTREVLLDHLYGALEEAEDAAVRAHLAACETCRASLESARNQRARIAEAARLPLAELETIPRRIPSESPFAWLGSRRVAASVAALLVGGLGLLGYRAVSRGGILARYPVVRIHGPSAVATEVPAEFLAEVATLDGDPVPSEVLVDVRRPAGTETIRAATDASGKARVLLPANLGRPGERTIVDFRVKTPDGVERRGSTIVVQDSSRLLARIGTDKPLYRPGEPVRIRIVALDRFRLTPAGDLATMIQVLDPRGAPLAQQVVPAASGVGAWIWPIPPEAAGGEYRLVLTGVAPGGDVFPPVERKFHVRSYRVPRIKGGIEFDRDAYGPGGKGEAWVSIERAEGGVPVGAALEAVVKVDGAEVSRQTLALRDSGRATIPFTLPDSIEKGRGEFAVVVRDGGSVETIAETLPIVVERLDVGLFPEGGDLVAGLANRIYFRVRDPKDEPADVEADVLDSGGRKVAEARVEDQGMGRLEFTPGAGESYRLVARRPEGIEIRATFPEVVESGIALRALDDVTPAGAPVRLEVASTHAGRYSVAAYCRGVLVAQDSVALEAGEPRVLSLPPTGEVGGVFRVTVFDPTGAPRAERLVSVEPPHRIDLEVRPSASQVAPGDPVKVEVTSRDEKGNPVSAVLGVSVVDDAVLSLAKDEDTPSLPMHFLLGLEVEELEDVSVFAGGPNAARAVDRLLGVQGWRRFAWRDPAAFLASNPKAGSRVVVAALDTPQGTDNEREVRAAVASATSLLDDRVRFGAGALGIVVGLYLLGGWIVSRLRSSRTARLATGLATAGVAVLLIAAIWSPSLVMHGPADAEAAIQFAPVLGILDGELDRHVQLGALGYVEDRVVDAFPALFAPIAPIPVILGEEVNLLAPLAGLDGQVNPFEMIVHQRARVALRADGFFIREELARRGRFQLLAREYVHRARPDHDGSRTDFTEVLYWDPGLVTGEDGRARFEFETCDSVTTFAVEVEAHDSRGALGAGSGSFRNRIPFYLEPKSPLALAAGDRLLLPVVAANDTGVPADVEVSLEVAGDLLRLESEGRSSVRVEPGSRGRALFDLRAGRGRGETSLTIAGKGPRGFADRSVRTIAIEPRGFPIEVARGGVLERRDVATFSLPVDLDRSTLAGSLRLYPSVLSTLVDGLEGMLQEPNGCFEQASSANYPNILVLTYLSEQEAAAPEVAKRARDLLARGYGRLAGYECRERGFEWFGGEPGHEALSAYGLMEFADMSRVHAVDASMVSRTRDWLLARRDGRGGFERNSRALDTFGRAPADVTDAYIVWALTEADQTVELAREVASVEERARASDDPYLVALAANALANRKSPAAKGLLDHLASMQREDGGLEGKSTSITSSTGANLEVETTALAAMAFLGEPARLPNAERAVRFLLERRQGGRFGATQATILALRALVEHARASRRTATDHDIALAVNGRRVATLHVPAGAPGAAAFERDLLEALEPGENRVEIETTGEETLPWALALRYHATRPADDPDCAVVLTTSLDREVVPEGETVRMEVTLGNRRDQGVPMTLARVGLPGGLEARAEQLKEWKEEGLVDFYETRPREVTLYFRGLAPREEKRLALDLVAAIPGEFEGPASSAYLYYTDDEKVWAPPARVRVTP